MCTCAEECVQSMQTDVLQHSRPLGSQTVALTLAFHIFLLRLKGFRKVFMTADLCIKGFFFQLQLQLFGCLCTTLAF